MDCSYTIYICSNIDVDCYLRLKGDYMSVHFAHYLENKRLTICGHSGIGTQATTIKEDITCKRCLKSLTAPDLWESKKMSIENNKIMEF